MTHETPTNTSATSPSRAGRTRSARRRPDLFGDFAHSTICRASECRECRLSTVLAAENRRAHSERMAFGHGAFPSPSLSKDVLAMGLRIPFAGSQNPHPRVSKIPSKGLIIPFHGSQNSLSWVSKIPLLKRGQPLIKGNSNHG